MKCYLCEKSGATKRPDPFNSDVNNDDTLVWICDECHNERSMSV